MFKVEDKNTRVRSLTYFTPFCSVSIADFEQFNVCWDRQKIQPLFSWCCLHKYHIVSLFEVSLQNLSFSLFKIHLFFTVSLHSISFLEEFLLLRHQLVTTCAKMFVIMSRARFRVNPHISVSRKSRNVLLETGTYLKFKWLQRDSNPQPISL